MSDRDKALLATLKAILEVCEEVVPSADIRLFRAEEALKDLEKAMVEDIPQPAAPITIINNPPALPQQAQPYMPPYSPLPYITCNT